MTENIDESKEEYKRIEEKREEENERVDKTLLDDNELSLDEVKMDTPYYNPGYIRKITNNARKTTAERKLRDGGPISLLITYFIDIITQFITLIFNMSKSVKSTGSQIVYDFFYQNGTKVIPENVKYGTIVSLKPLRVLLNIIFPPLGIFLARGMYGIHHVIIALLLVKFRIIDLPLPILSICYAFIITHIPSYSERFNKYDFYRLMTIRALIDNCKKRKLTSNFRDMLPLIIFIGFIFIFMIIMYISAKFINTNKK